jgi:hypothetical protein
MFAPVCQRAEVVEVFGRVESSMILGFPASRSRILLWGALVLALQLSGCTVPRLAKTLTAVSMPVSLGWYNGERVYYVTTDITDPPMARAAGVNLALRMRDAIPPYPKPPEQKDVLERVYKFPNGEQDAVFASIPRPLGPSSSDVQYSPLWILYAVKTAAGKESEPLTSEEAILAAEDGGKVTITRTSIVINCPIVGTEHAGLLPGMKFAN